MKLIILLVILVLAWLEIIPVRYWIKKSQVAYEGKKARLIIRILKWFRWFL